jgi:hypothetical protein
MFSRMSTILQTPPSSHECCPALWSGLAHGFALLSTRIRGWLESAICRQILELPEIAKFTLELERTTAFTWVFKLLTLTTPVSTARTMCSSAFSEAPEVVC